MTARAYIAWCKHEEDLKAWFKYISKHKASIVYLFYKRLVNMLCRHNRVCICPDINRVADQSQLG